MLTSNKDKKTQHRPSGVPVTTIASLGAAGQTATVDSVKVSLRKRC